MIRHLNIRDFAIIENAEIDFHEGLNIITGETGSGKSIIIEAVNLALGSRADTAFIRSGKKKALVQMIAEYQGEEYIITREISSSGKNICRINDEIVTLAHLGRLSRKLADIHGQYDHQSLLDPDRHITLVDSYHKDLISPAKERVSEAYSTYSSVSDKLKQLLSDLARDQRERDFMQYEFDELEEADLMADEDKELEEKISLLENSERIYENLAGAYHAASESDDSILSSLKKIADMVSETSSFSDELESLSSRLSGLYYDLEDIASGLRDCRDSTVFSPEELDNAIARLEKISKLKMKHGMTLDELIEYKNELDEKLSSIQNSDTLKKELEDSLEVSRKELDARCSELSELRKSSALELEKKITAELEELNFNDASFSISFSERSTPSADGKDTVEFLISTNRGEPLKPLAKIASGGEMSRIMLAFKNITGDYDGIPTMIFDEIDSGISGITASIVGQKLNDIAQHHQIICITHLPQIAAYGRSNYRISKVTDEKMTYTTVLELSHEDKVREIARLLGGSTITDITLRSAEELIGSSR